jgi:hypothetical protein
MLVKTASRSGRFGKWLPAVIGDLALDATFSYVGLRTLTNVTVPVIGALAIDATDVELRPLTNVSL